MSLRPFAYDRPATVPDTIALLTGDPGAARPLAGGTDLLTLMKGEIVAPERLVDIKRLDDLTDEIAVTERGLEIGALATLAEIETDPLVTGLAPALAQAAGLAATPQLRHMATLGGNLLQRPRCWYFRNAQVPCWLKGGDDCPARDGENQLHALFGDGPCVAVHPSDPATALTAMDAEIVARGPAGERVVPVEVFFQEPDDGRRTENTLGDDELITAVRIPTQPDGSQSTYLKAMDRKVWAFALVGVAASLAVTNGAIRHARIVLGGVANVPRRAHQAEQALLGSSASAEAFARAAEAALAGAKPLEHNGYKLQLTRALVRQSLESLAESVGA
jgi:xanthine dehydrogenase YagS FAD-binding subunit